MENTANKPQIKPGDIIVIPNYRHDFGRDTLVVDIRESDGFLYGNLSDGSRAKTGHSIINIGPLNNDYLDEFYPDWHYE